MLTHTASIRTEQTDVVVPQLVERQVERTPTAIAIEHDGNAVTYAELNARANRLADYLRQIGVRTESLIGICLERSVDMVVTLLAILKAGGGLYSD